MAPSSRLHRYKQAESGRGSRRRRWTARSRRQSRKQCRSDAPQDPPVAAVIDHLAFTVANFDKEKTLAILKAWGLKHQGPDGGPRSDGGKISRRKLIATLAVAATTIYGAGKAPTTVEAATPNGRGSLKTLLVNHISYGCPDYRPAHDFYRDVMGIEVVPAEQNANATSATLAFGPKGAIPLNSPYRTPVTFVIVRNGRGTQEPQTGNRGGRGGTGPPVPPAPKVEAVVNHIAYTIADWDQKRVFEELKKHCLVRIAN